MVEAYKDQVDTILTCDNGIVAMEQVEKAKIWDDSNYNGSSNLYETEDGIPYPIADAIINPNQSCGYPFKRLCGVHCL